MKATITIRAVPGDKHRLNISAKFNPPQKGNGPMNAVTEATFIMLNALKRNSEGGEATHE